MQALYPMTVASIRHYGLKSPSSLVEEYIKRSILKNTRLSTSEVLVRLDDDVSLAVQDLIRRFTYSESPLAYNKAIILLEGEARVFDIVDETYSRLARNISAPAKEMNEASKGFLARVSGFEVERGDSKVYERDMYFISNMGHSIVSTSVFDTLRYSIVTFGRLVPIEVKGESLLPGWAMAIIHIYNSALGTEDKNATQGTFFERITTGEFSVTTFNNAKRDMNTWAERRLGVERFAKGMNSPAEWVRRIEGTPRLMDFLGLSQRNKNSV
jgi:hypothetical protein